VNPINPNSTTNHSLINPDDTNQIDPENQYPQNIYEKIRSLRQEITDVLNYSSNHPVNRTDLIRKIQNLLPSILDLDNTLAGYIDINSTNRYQGILNQEDLNNIDSLRSTITQTSPLPSPISSPISRASSVDNTQQTSEPSRASLLNITQRTSTANRTFRPTITRSTNPRR
jgi:hypothetical protein